MDRTDRIREMRAAGARVADIAADLGIRQGDVMRVKPRDEAERLRWETARKRLSEIRSRHRVPVDETVEPAVDVTGLVCGVECRTRIYGPPDKAASLLARMQA